MSQILYSAIQTGNNNNAGTVDAPFKTAAFGISRIGAGDTLLVGPGIYNESFPIGTIPSGTSWNNKVRIAGYPGASVWFAPIGTNRVLEFGAVQQYIEFDGINLDGTGVEDDTVKINDGQPGVALAHHIRIMNAEVIGPFHPPGPGGPIAGPTGQPFQINGNDASTTGANEFLNLKVHGGMQTDFDHAFYIESFNNLVEGCDIYDFTGAGIQIYNGHGFIVPTNNIVRNCIIHDSRRTGAGQRHEGLTIVGNGNKVYNNVIYNINSEGSITVGISLFSSVNAEIYNNTVYNSGVGINIDGTSSGTQVKNNISHLNAESNYQDAGSGTIQSNNLFNNVDPRFVNAAAFDFRLQDGSPAIDAGTTV